MNLFRAFGTNLSYKNLLQQDGAFSISHINYGKSPMFNEKSSIDIAKNSRKNSLSSLDHIDNVFNNCDSFNGVEKGLKKGDRLDLWKNYWLEYINAFDKLINILPCSVVTVFVGRQSMEIGFKYLLLKKTNQIIKTHDLGELSTQLFSEYSINYDYMKWVNEFCGIYSMYIEGGNPEYFRFPEYKENDYFAGNRLDLNWLSYNFALIILKLLHLAELEDEFN